MTNIMTGYSGTAVTGLSVLCLILAAWIVIKHCDVLENMLFAFFFVVDMLAAYMATVMVDVINVACQQEDANVFHATILLASDIYMILFFIFTMFVLRARHKAFAAD